jgi:hypothetical protein
MVAIDAVPAPVQFGADARSTHCPRWLQGIATINRLRSSSTNPLQPDASLPAALDRLCAHGQGKVAERIAAARLLPSICRHGDPEVLGFLLGDSISSSGCGKGTRLCIRKSVLHDPHAIIFTCRVGDPQWHVLVAGVSYV